MKSINDIYLKEDMTIPQVMWQRGIELVVLEIAMCAVIYLIMGDSVSIAVYVAILISTAVCDVLPCEVVSGKRRGR